MKSWRGRLAAASVLRSVPGWRQRGVAGGITDSATASSLPAGWRQEAAKQLSELVEGGIAVDVDRCERQACRCPPVLLVCRCTGSTRLNIVGTNRCTTAGMQ